jgi:hypothetical protein
MDDDAISGLSESREGEARERVCACDERAIQSTKDKDDER